MQHKRPELEPGIPISSTAVSPNVASLENRTPGSLFSTPGMSVAPRS